MKRIFFLTVYLIFVSFCSLHAFAHAANPQVSLADHSKRCALAPPPKHPTIKRISVKVIIELAVDRPIIECRKTFI